MGRNNGAKVAKNDLILFLDADVIIRKDFLEKNVKEITKNRLGTAGVYSKSIQKRSVSSIFISILNFVHLISERICPVIMGYCIFVRKNVFNKIEGFNEKIIFNEDVDFVRRASKISKFRMLNSVPVGVSMRRYEVVGYLKMGVLYIFYQLRIALWGHFKKEFGYFKINYKGIKK